jgi:hypothetical protein
MIRIVSSLEIDCEQILDRAISDFYDTDHSVDKYLMSFSYKPTSNNLRVIPFVRRMEVLRNEQPELAELYHVPAPLEVIRYAITKKNITRSMRGTMKNIKKTDLAEYEQVIKHFGYQVDKDYYLMSLASTYAQFITYKEFDFLDKNIEVKKIKEIIQAKYVKPKLKKIISCQPENIRITELDAKLKVLYKNNKQIFADYVQTVYPTVARILLNLYRSTKSTGYDYILDIAKIESTKPPQTKLSPGQIAERMKYNKSEIRVANYNKFKLQPRKQPLFLNSDELEELQYRTLAQYKPHICYIEGKLEKALFDYMSTLPEVINYNDIETVITENDIKIMEEFEKNVKKFIIYHQYYFASLSKDIIS